MNEEEYPNCHQIPTKRKDITIICLTGVSFLINIFITIVWIIYRKENSSKIFYFYLNILYCNFFHLFSYNILYFFYGFDHDRKINTFLCKIQSMMIGILHIAQDFLVFFLGISFYKSLIQNEEINNKIKFYYYLISYGVPFIIMIIFLILDILGYNKDYCFISIDDYDKLNISLFSIYVIKWSLFIITIIFLLVSLKKISRNKVSILEKDNLRKNAFNIYFYSFIQLINDLPPSIFRIAALYYYSKHKHKCLFDPNINTITFCAVGIIFPFVFAYLSGLVSIIYNLNNDKIDDSVISYNELIPKNYINS